MLSCPDCRAIYERERNGRVWHGKFRLRRNVLEVARGCRGGRPTKTSKVRRLKFQCCRARKFWRAFVRPYPPLTRLPVPLKALDGIGTLLAAFCLPSMKRPRAYLKLAKHCRELRDQARDNVSRSGLATLEWSHLTLAESSQVLRRSVRVQKRLERYYARLALRRLRDKVPEMSSTLQRRSAGR